MYGWDNLQGQNQQSNPQYQHPWPQFSQYEYNHVSSTSNTMPLPVVATPGVNMAGWYCSNQSAQVFNYFSFVV